MLIKISPTCWLNPQDVSAVIACKQIQAEGDDGNAFSPNGKIFRLKLPPNGFVSAQYIIVKKTKGVFDSTEFLSFAEDLNESCRIIESFAIKLNDEICDMEDD